MGSRSESGGLGPLGFSMLMFSMAACLPLFFLGPIAYKTGLSLEQALAAALIGNAIVATAMALNGHAGVARGIDFPRQAREVFGVSGAKLVVALRGIVGALWYGVEAYNGALALVMIALLASGWNGDLLSTASRLVPAALALYIGSMYLVVKKGVKGIGAAASIAGPLLLLYFAWLAWWLHSQGFKGHEASGVPWSSSGFLLYLAIQTNWWATVAVNMSDLSRTARDWGSVWVGVALGMVGGQLLGTYLGYELAAMTGKALPQEIIAAYAPGVAATLLGLLFAFLAPWTTDITANVPALIDLLRGLGRLSWERAAQIAALLGVFLAPWWALGRAQEIVDYVSGFAASYGVLLGPILGPMIASYWILKSDGRQQSGIALAALAIGVLASYASAPLTGGLSYVRIGAVNIPFPSGLAWYVGVISSMAAYLALAVILHATAPRVRPSTSSTLRPSSS